MKIQNLIGLVILVISIVVYIFYPSVLLLITIGALIAVLLIKTDFFNRIKGQNSSSNKSGSGKTTTGKTNKQKKKKK